MLENLFFLYSDILEVIEISFSQFSRILEILEIEVSIIPRILEMRAAGGWFQGLCCAALFFFLACSWNSVACPIWENIMLSMFVDFSKKGRAEKWYRMAAVSRRDLSYETDSGPKTKTS